MSDNKRECNDNPFVNANIFPNGDMTEANSELNSVPKTIRARVYGCNGCRGDSLKSMVDHEYVIESTWRNINDPKLKLDKWRVLMRWIVKDHKVEDLAEWGWQFYKTIAVVPPGDLCVQSHYKESHLIIGAFDSELEAKNLCGYLKTKLVVFLVARKQLEMHKKCQKYTVLTKDSFAYVPIQDFSKPWTDAELYKEYELEQDEIAFIESNIKVFEEEER